MNAESFTKQVHMSADNALAMFKGVADDLGPQDMITTIQAHVAGGAMAYLHVFGPELAPTLWDKMDELVQMMRNVHVENGGTL